MIHYKNWIDSKRKTKQRSTKYQQQQKQQHQTTREKNAQIMETEQSRKFVNLNRNRSK